METPCRIYVAWSVPEAILSLADANQALSALGFVAEPLPTGDSGPSHADLAVLHGGSFDNLDQLHEAYEELSRPSLLVVSNQDEETAVLRWPDLPLTTDVCRAEALREQLPDRLRRLAAVAYAGIGWDPGDHAGQALQKHVYGREYLNQRLAREFANAQKQCRSLTLAWLELGDFGRITKTFGDSAGGHVLKAVARVILANIRVVDWLAQFDDNEFCLVMPDTWLEEGTQVAERIEKDLRSLTVRIDEQQTVTPRVNIGIAELTDDEETFEDLLQKAAEAALIRTISG